MAEVNIASALAMGGALLAIVVGVRLVRNWHPSPVASGGGVAVGDVLQSPVTWSVAFGAVAIAAGIVGIAAVGGPIPGLTDEVAWIAIVAILGVGLALLLSGGVYATARNRGLPRSIAVAAGSITLGALFLIAITLQLVFGG